MNLLDGTYRIYPIGVILSQEKLCLTVKDNSRNACADIVLRNMETNNSAQKFSFEKHKNHYAIRVNHSKLVLDIFEWRKNSGTKIIQYGLHTGDNQLWDVLELSSSEIDVFASLIPGGKELLKNKHIYLIKSAMVKDYGLDINDGALVNSENPCAFIIEKV